MGGRERGGWRRGRRGGEGVRRVVGRRRDGGGEDGDGDGDGGVEGAGPGVGWSWRVEMD